jgi:uncharacterized protein YxjI
MTTLLQMERVFVRQRAKLIELTNEYGVFDEQGNQVAIFRQEGQTAWRKALRLLTKVDQFLTHTYSLYDAAGVKVLGLTRPGTVWKSKVEVTDGAGMPVGRLLQENLVGKIRFRMEGPDGQPLGYVNAENWRAWDFHIADATGAEIGRITKKWAGTAKEMFTTADNYLVEIAPGLDGSLRLLALASGVGIDTALKQSQN